MQLNKQDVDEIKSESGMESQKITNTDTSDEENQSLQSAKEFPDNYSAEWLEDQKKFFQKVVNKDELPRPLDTLAQQLQDFYDERGEYYPKKHLPFAEDVLVGVPENICRDQSTLPKRGLPDDFERKLMILENCPNDPNPFWYGHRSTQLGRLGGKVANSKEPIHISEEGSIYREFETHGIVTPLLDQSIFMKRRIDQDLTSILNEHYKDTPEEEIPKFLSWEAASEVLDTQLPLFVNQIENRNHLDRKAAIRGFMPVSRLETNVIQSEIQRRQNTAETMLSKRNPELDDKKKKQMDRKRQNKIDSRARQKAEQQASKRL
jgi:hypothetical protein